MTNLRTIKKPNFTEFTQEMLLITCIFSGCDYLDSIKGIGFVRAQKLVEAVGEGDTVSSSSYTSNLHYLSRICTTHHSLTVYIVWRGCPDPERRGQSSHTRRLQQRVQTSDPHLQVSASVLSSEKEACDAE